MTNIEFTVRMLAQNFIHCIADFAGIARSNFATESILVPYRNVTDTIMVEIRKK